MNKVTFELPVHTFQVDFGGIVSNIVYVEWMEIGRTRLLEAVGMPIERIWEEGIAPVLVHTSIDYKRPFRLGDTARAEVWVSELRRTSAQVEHRFYHAGDDALMASGRQVGLFVDKHTLRPHRLAPEERARFEAYLGEEGEAP